MDIESLKKERDKQVNRIFILLIEIAFIFAIPAAITVLIGKYTPILLAVAFVLSWLMVIVLYKRKTKRLRELDDLINAQK